MLNAISFGREPSGEFLRLLFPRKRNVSLDISTHLNAHKYAYGREFIAW